MHRATSFPMFIAYSTRAAWETPKSVVPAVQHLAGETGDIKVLIKWWWGRAR